MKQTPLKRKSAMKRSQPRRYWQAARDKCESEHFCRVFNDGQGDCGGKLETAHIVGREHDRPVKCPRCDGSGLDPHDAYADADGVDNIEAPCRFCGHGQAEYIDGTAHVLVVQSVSVIPLCTAHHKRYDAHELDILHVLTLEEQVQAVQDAGGIENARKRLCPSLYRKAAA
jgi:hypothetical protein